MQRRNFLHSSGIFTAGINAGAVYVGGHVRPWLWDIFNATHPLSRQTFYYSVKISGIRDATEEEIINGVPSTPKLNSCSPKGCC
jgi:hypothetical protein